MKAIFLPPRELYAGNLVWRKDDSAGRKEDISCSLDQLRNKGYWASAFPEGDGIIFTENTNSKSHDEIFVDISSCFGWVAVQHAESSDSNEALATLEDTATLKCIAIVPLEKIFIEETFALGDFKFFCRKECDTEAHERLGSFATEYLQFETFFAYKDLLRINKTIAHNDMVIEQCLALAEHALDIIRFQFSSFKKKEFTPNPAGQQESGFFAIEIIPMGETHLKPVNLSGISRPFSMSNNWLGPEVCDCNTKGRGLLIEISQGREDELALAVSCALRACRQSFYSLGNESQFLNLVFVLDGLVDPGKMTGMCHHKYIATLLSGGDVAKFEKVLVRYIHLYSEVRNKLVHQGQDFYQLPDKPDDACETIYQFIKDIIILIEEKGFTSMTQLKEHAQLQLQSQSFIEVVNQVNHAITVRKNSSTSS